MGRQHQEMDRPGVRQVPEGSGKQVKMEETGCEIICGAPMTLAVKGQMRDEMREAAFSPLDLISNSNERSNHHKYALHHRRLNFHTVFHHYTGVLHPFRQSDFCPTKQNQTKMEKEDAKRKQTE